MAISYTKDNLIESNLEFNNDIYFNNLSGNLKNLNFIDEIRKEDACLREFIHHINKDTVKKYLVAQSQDKSYSTKEFDTIDSKDISIQLNITTLANELSLSQCALFAKYL